MPRTTGSTSGTAWRRSSAALVAGALLLASGAAAADPKLDCPTQSEEAQRLRDKQRYLEARDLFQSCSQSSCPSVVRKDCAKWLIEIDESMPSIVVAAQDERGQDLADAALKVDGKLVSTRLDGRPVALDPGEHVLVVEGPGKKAVTQKIVARVNEKNRLVRVDFGGKKADPAPAPGPAPEPVAPAPPPPAKRFEVPVVSWILGGVGVAGLGSFAFFGLSGKSELTELRASGGCAPFCRQEQLDDVKSTMLIADVSLVVGVVALGAATLVAIMHNSGKKPVETARLSW